ncbi:unnamed protein product [marine sediment metagenome]|uniref:Uncharacterized protein n=1 Tax=marine sediment metagenome TaxID=412755 RepID=X0Z2J8_9ZZZZ
MFRDALGRRIQKKIENSGDPNPTHRYHYEECRGDPEEHDGENPCCLASPCHHLTPGEELGTSSYSQIIDRRASRVSDGAK